MTRRTRLLAIVAAVLLTGAGVAGTIWYRRVLDLDRAGRDTAEQLQQQIVALDTERARLRARLDGLVGASPNLAGMPHTPVKVAVPTTLVRQLVERTMEQLAERVTLRLADLRVRRTGTIRRGVTLGDYDLRVTITRVTATLMPGTPRLAFGGNRIEAALPLRLASGTGRAVVDFTWDGRALAGAVCGDLTLAETVTGAVTPRSYSLAGALLLEATDTGIVLQPKLPRLQVQVDVEPSAASWAAFQQVLDDKRGLCGFIVDRVDILAAVKRVVARGFRVRIPTERVPSVALPVALQPSLVVRGAPVAVGIRIGALTVTDRTIWLGANLSLAVGGATAPVPGPSSGGVTPPTPGAGFAGRPSRPAAPTP